MRLPIPIRDLVLAKPFASDEMSSSGIIVPENCRETSNKLLVLAVGKGTKKNPMPFMEGQTIFRIKDAGDEVLVDGQKYFLIRSNDILAQE